MRSISIRRAIDRLDDDVPPDIHFIIDSAVAELYRDRLSNVLSQPSVLLVEATEHNKSLNPRSRLCRAPGGARISPEPPAAWNRRRDHPGHHLFSRRHHDAGRAMDILSDDAALPGGLLRGIEEFDQFRQCKEYRRHLHAPERSPYLDGLSRNPRRKGRPVRGGRNPEGACDRRPEGRSTGWPGIIRAFSPIRR